MSELSAENIAEIVTTCETCAEDVADALSRSLECEITLTVGDPENYSSDSPTDEFGGPGLAMLFKFGNDGFVAWLPESSGMIPEWYANPDPTGESVLSTMAQELSMLLIPETMIADDFKAARIENLSDALKLAKVADNAALIPLQLSSADSKSNLSLIWPLANPDSFYDSPVDEQDSDEPVSSNPVSSNNEESIDAAESAVEEPATPAKRVILNPNDFSVLPAYSKSLLKIQLPVRVILAEKKEKLEDVTELAAGTIIKFNKNCEQPLELYIENQLIAEGEAIKIGDKFGFRVSSMLMPEEHFTKIKPRTAG